MTRTQAETRLAMLAHAIESTEEMICITDLEDRFIFVNRAFQRAYGYTEAEILGKSPAILFASSNPAGLMEEVLKQSHAGGWHGEVMDRRKDGSEFPIVLSTSPIKTTQGTVLGLVGIARDISERKRAEKQTAAFASLCYRLSAATTPAQAAEIILSASTELFGWDAGYFHLYEEASDELVPVLTMDTMNGQRVAVSAMAITRDPSPLMRKVMRQGARLVNRAPGSADLEDLIPFGDTARRSASMMYVPIHSNEKVLGILSIQSYSPQAYSENDLVLLQALADQCGGALQRIQITEALRESERKLRLIAENTSDTIFAFDMERRFVYANPAVLALSGYTFKELQRQTFLDWVHDEDRERVRKYWEELYSGKAQSELEFRLVTRTGQARWCSSSWGPLLDEAGRQIGVRGHVRDITERNRLEREVLESTANERRHIGHELHDGLGQYLAGIAFRAKALEQTLSRAAAPFDREAHELVRLIGNAMRQARSLARGLDPVDLETIGLPAALQNLADETRRFFEVDCRLHCPGTRLELDSQVALSLYRIVQEAIHNAIRHGEARHIEIVIETAPDHLGLRIQDDGIGFDVESTHQTGMGLRVMRYRARSIGGSLKITSQSGKGTRINCEIPAGKRASTEGLGKSPS